MSRIPPSAPADIRESFREVWERIDRILGQRNVDWHGRRIINAGDAVDTQDYVTKGQMGEEITAAVSPALALIHRNARAPLQIFTGGGVSGGGTMGDPLTAELPVDTVFGTATHVNPTALLGYGTWQLFAIGRSAGAGSPLELEYKI